MIFSTDRAAAYGLLRWLFVIVFISGCGLFIVLSVVNAISFSNDSPQAGFSSDMVLNFVTLVLLAPGVAPLCIAFYFMILLKKLIYNLIGVLAVPLAVVLHYIIMAFAAHSSPSVAFLIGFFELLIFLSALYLFHRFFVKGEAV